MTPFWLGVIVGVALLLILETGLVVWLLHGAIEMDGRTSTIEDGTTTL